MENVMETPTDQTPKAKQPAEPESAHKHTTSTVTMIAMCAFGAFALGAMVGQAWPAAVACCGLSLMGVGVAYIMLGRNKQ